MQRDAIILRGASAYLGKLRRILVTGGAGFIGHHLVTKLLEDPDCRITIIDDLSNQNSKKRINHLPPSIAFYKEDIRNRQAISDIVKRGAHACVHLAAKISVVDSIRNPAETIDVNVNGTRVPITVFRPLSLLPRRLYMALPL
jgi:UDP-glucose 4-epimerase